MKREFVTRCEEETIELGSSLGASLRGGDTVALFGELGAGKTRFVRGLAIGLGHDPRWVRSPTYVLVNEYDSPNALAPLLHVDAYRLTSNDALAELGLDDVVLGSSALVVEWAQRVQEQLAPERLDVMIEHLEQQTRRITISSPSSWLEDRPELAWLAS